MENIEWSLGNIICDGVENAARSYMRENIESVLLSELCEIKNEIQDNFMDNIGYNIEVSLRPDK